MTVERAVVRGRHMKLLVAALEAWPDGPRPLALAPPGLLEGVAAAGGLDWLPVGQNLALTRAIYEGLGAAEADRFFRAQALESFHGPILQTMVVTAVRIFGLDPASFARWIPKAWYMIFREVGVWTVGEQPPGATSVVLTIGELDAACAEDPVWLRSVSRSLSAILDLAQVHGAVELLPRARGSRQAQFEFRWAARAEVGAPR